MIQTHDSNILKYPENIHDVNVALYSSLFISIHLYSTSRLIQDVLDWISSPPWCIAFSSHGLRRA